MAGGVCGPRLDERGPHDSTGRTALPHLGRMPGRPAHDSILLEDWSLKQTGLVHETSPSTSVAAASRRNAAAGPIE
jgi:hypothetical protein